MLRRWREFTLRHQGYGTASRQKETVPCLFVSLSHHSVLFLKRDLTLTLLVARSRTPRVRARRRGTSRVSAEAPERVQPRLPPRPSESPIRPRGVVNYLTKQYLERRKESLRQLRSVTALIQP